MTPGRLLPSILLLIVLELGASAGLIVAHGVRARDDRKDSEANRATAAALRLTSLSLWSEPLYCRHPAETEPFAAFADHPSAVEHFPAGSFVPPSATGPGPSPPRRSQEAGP